MKRFHNFISATIAGKLFRGREGNPVKRDSTVSTFMYVLTAIGKV